MTFFSLISKLRKKKKIRLIFLVILIIGLSLVFCILLKTLYRNLQSHSKVNDMKQNRNIRFQYVVVHFDLKGAPPMIPYLQSILKQLKDYGTTALLIEYEDMFPYEGKLVNLTARNCYKRDELKKFLVAANRTGLEVIPLVPTYGHLEFALKLKEFQHLREDPKMPDILCPSKKESRDLLKEMLRQVIKFHKRVSPLKHLHIGCNEVRQVKKCEICSKKDSNETTLIIQHMKFISSIVRSLSPITKILIWDDIFKDMKPTDYMGLRFPDMENVFWESAYTNLESLQPALRRSLHMFENKWIAAAYKGADGPTRTIPILNNRFNNYLNWLNFVFDSKYGGDHSFKGIIFTGKSRLSHLEPPCELLPVSYPSLLVGLIMIKNYQNGTYLLNADISLTDEIDQKSLSYVDLFVTDQLNTGLKCQKSIIDGYLSSFQAMTCIFDGSDLYVILSWFSETRAMYVHSLFGGHDTSLSVETNIFDMQEGYLNMNNIKNILEMCSSSLQELIVVESQIVDAMTPYFDKYVTEEYIILKLSKMKKRLHDLLQYLNDYYIVKDWPRRPIGPTSVMKQLVEKKTSSVANLKLLDD